jgi:hypothetical protein
MSLTHKMTSNHRQQSVEIDGRRLAIEFSKAALNALAQRSTPLLAEMELYFSCLIRKQVRFRDATTADRNGDENTPASVPLNDQLHVRFRPVMTRACGKDYEGDEPPLTDFPIVNARAYVPRWLHIDYRKDQWQGEFGYDRGE